MRILHTSDLHLGRSFHGRSLFHDHELWCNELASVCENLEVGAVLISGDVYDQASPRTDVIEQFSRLLTRLRAQEIEVVVTSGNHDSAARLGFASQLLESAGVHFRTRIEDIRRPVTLEDGTLVYGIPYLDPRSAAAELGSNPTHHEVLGAAVAEAATDRQRRSNQHAIVMAHCFASGAEASDSERILDTGNLGLVSANLFDGFDYAALGHLHGRQIVRGNVRYSGSPLAFSFSEARHTKGFWLLETSEDALTVEDHEWEHTLDLACLTGEFEELMSSPEYSWAESCLCQITVTDRRRPAHPMERLRTRFPDALELNFANLAGANENSYSSRLARAQSPVEACAAFYDQVRGRELDPYERAEIVSAVGQAEKRRAASDVDASSAEGAEA
ncbi:exonuclease SbcCD subunit D [Kocuria sp. TGY1127_2]|uniref:exonuclease SbcCD subunit D n=1 Tax=Kocuria sp. TGY1127_2 TaxID=2711328 RepID=UPI0015BADFB8|nr:exonuclease SbcCD subunit D [Kocuria sp. TGY1127_2]